jgi:CheY-like chemotaxis protein
MMETKEKRAVRVLVVGNNPIDLSGVSGQLALRRQTIETEIAFDTRSLLDRLQRFVPDYIVLDDNLGRDVLKETVSLLAKDRRTRGAPITVLKNSNYIETLGSGALNFVLKKNLTGEGLYRELLHSLKFRKTQQFLAEAYRKRKGQLSRLLKPTPGYPI